MSLFESVCGLAVRVMLSVSPAIGQPQQAPLDLVISNGRTIDPETKLDAIRNVGIKGGKIVAISEAPLKGQLTADATDPALPILLA
jgi:adenine deaminase